MIQTFDNLSECTFTDNFNQLEPKCNMIAFLNSVVALFIIKTVVYQSLHVAGLDFEFILT